MTTDIDDVVLGEYYSRLESLDPLAIAQEVKRGVMGQDEFIDEFVPVICLAIKRCVAEMRGCDARFLPRLSSSFIVGATASGKTHTIRELCNALDIDYHFIDCTSLTGPGWRGNSVDAELARVGAEQRRNPGRIALIIWDEADKMRYNKDRGTVSSFNPQPSLLKPLDGGVYRFDNSGGVTSVDMRLVINIFAGAFTGIERIVEKRHDTGGATIGFGAEIKGALSQEDISEQRRSIWLEDLIAWGMMPELCGRCGAVFNLPTLDANSMRCIVKGSERSVETKFAHLTPPGCSLSISDAAADLVADAATKSPVGVRLLENALNKVVSAAIAQACKNQATSIVITARDNDLEYELGFDPIEAERDIGLDERYRIGLSGETAHRDDRAPHPLRIADRIDKACARLDLEYFVDGGNNMAAVAEVVAKSVRETLVFIGLETPDLDTIKLMVEAFFADLMLREGERCTIGGLYIEAQRSFAKGKFSRDLSSRMKYFFELDPDRDNNERRASLFKEAEKLFGSLDNLSPDDYRFSARAIQTFARFVTIPERLEKFKRNLYERFPLMTQGNE